MQKMFLVPLIAPVLLASTWSAQASMAPASVSRSVLLANGAATLDFVVSDVGGKEGRLSDFKGEVLLDAALAQAGIKVASEIIAGAKLDQAKRDALCGDGPGTNACSPRNLPNGRSPRIHSTTLLSLTSVSSIIRTLTLGGTNPPNPTS